MTTKIFAVAMFFAGFVGCNCASLSSHKDGAPLRLESAKVFSAEAGSPTESRWRDYTKLVRGLCSPVALEDDRIVFYRSVNCSDILRYNNGVYPWYPEAMCVTREEGGITIYDCKDVTDKRRLAQYRLRNCISLEAGKAIAVWCDPKRGGVPLEFLR